VAKDNYDVGDIFDRTDEPKKVKQQRGKEATHARNIARLHASTLTSNKTFAITEKQINYLDDIPYQLKKNNGIRVSKNSIVRLAIDDLMKKDKDYIANNIARKQ